MPNGTGFRRNAAASRWRGAVALLLVITVHVALYTWLHGSGGWRLQHASRTEPARVGVRWLPWVEPSVKPPPVNAQPVAPRPRSAFAPIRAATPVRADPATLLRANLVPNVARPDAGPAPGPPAPPASQASQPPPLNLVLTPENLRRAAARNPALDDVRANRTRSTPEQRMAAALDTRVIEEDFGDGRRRIRRGADCVIVAPSRIGQLMPFNEAAARTPSLVGACP